jgi:uncharacterized protein (PEP-CTERM system associated)
MQRQLFLLPWLLGSLVGGMLPMLAHAQEDSGTVDLKPNWRIAPNAAVELTYTDNVAPGRGAKTADFITRIKPGIKIEGKSARARGNLDYSWQQNLYADNSQLDNHQQSLRANGKLELVEQWMFIDASGNITQQPVSAFGTQGVGNELVNANRTETSAYQLSPYVQGRLVGATDYELRYNHSEANANAGTIASYGGTTTDVWSARLNGATPLTLLGWSLYTDRQNVKLGSTRSFESNRFTGSLEFRIDPQVKLSVNAGRESDNYSLAQLQSRTTSGYGVEWAPTERTAIALKQDRRSYGNSHSISLSHRTALTAWKLSDTRNVSLPGQQLTQAPVSTAYDLLNMQLTSSIPDPVQRAQAVTQLLQLYGIPADSVVFGNIMSSQALILRRQEASVALIGANNTVTLTVQRSSSERLGSGAALPGDDLLLSSNIRQSGLSGSWAHKLSPQSSLTLNALTSRNRGMTSNLDTRLRSLQLLLTSKLGPHTTATAGLRSSSFDNAGGNSYDEQAVMGSFLVTF